MSRRFCFFIEQKVRPIYIIAICYQLETSQFLPFFLSDYRKCLKNGDYYKDQSVYFLNIFKYAAEKSADAKVHAVFWKQQFYKYVKTEEILNINFN